MGGGGFVRWGLGGLCVYVIRRRLGWYLDDGWLWEGLCVGKPDVSCDVCGALVWG